MQYLINGEKLTAGVCYYPEHWPESLWKDDIGRMLSHGIRFIRIGEFAWSLVEPREGEFNHDFFDRFLGLVRETEMKVIFGTPTATPPAWLTEKYPEVLNADIRGNIFRHGSRRHYNYTSPVYRRKCAEITEVIAARYAKWECITGWQLDNELNCEVSNFYSEADSAAFRTWLRDRYQTTDALNEAWGTVFWNQTYTSWSEVYVPRYTCNGANNPHQMLDYYRFISDSCRSFAQIQSEIIRKYKKDDDFITTNGLFGHLDNHAFCRQSLSFFTYDSYPNFPNQAGKPVDENGLRDRWWSRKLAETRSVSPHFGIMEQQTGANGWNIWPGVPNPRPGQITLWAMQSVAHGADFISFFRWRTAAFGTEMYWNGILDPSGRDNERLAEVGAFTEILTKISCVAKEHCLADVAILKDYDNVFDSEADVWHSQIEQASMDSLFTVLQKTHTPFDYVYFYEGGISADLHSYRVIFYPHPLIVTPERIRVLEQYVKQGGILILGARAGCKDHTGRCVTKRLPGLFAGLAGADVKEYSFLQPDQPEVLIDWDGEKIPAALFADRLSGDGAGDITGRHVSDYFAGDGAISVNRCADGCVYYYGSAFSDAAVEAFLRRLGVKEPYADVVTVPESVELAVRGPYLFLLNYRRDACSLHFHRPVTDLISGAELSGETALAGYGFIVADMSRPA